MSEITPIQTKNKALLQGIEKVPEFLKFIEWLSIPKAFREPKTQKELALQLQVDEATLSDWKKRPQIWDEVVDRTKQWARERTPNVIAALYRKAIKDGMSFEAKLWLQFVEGWKEKSELETKNAHFIITRGDGGIPNNRPVPGSATGLAETDTGTVAQ